VLPLIIQEVSSQKHLENDPSIRVISNILSSTSSSTCSMISNAPTQPEPQAAFRSHRQILLERLDMAVKYHRYIHSTELTVTLRHSLFHLHLNGTVAANNDHSPAPSADQEKRNGLHFRTNHTHTAAPESKSCSVCK